MTEKALNMTPSPSLMVAINELADMVHDNAVVHEFHDFSENNSNFMSRELLNLVGEVSELREAERDGKLFQPCDKAEKMQALGLEPLTCIEEEYADIIIRAFDQLKRLNPNGKTPGQAVLIKHLFNTTRPIKHGRQTA